MSDFHARCEHCGKDSVVTIDASPTDVIEAAIRADERAAIVAWLRSRTRILVDHDTTADRIEAGEHLKVKP